MKKVLMLLSSLLFVSCNSEIRDIKQFYKEDVTISEVKILPDYMEDFNNLLSREHRLDEIESFVGVYKADSASNFHNHRHGLRARVVTKKDGYKQIVYLKDGKVEGFNRYNSEIGEDVIKQEKAGGYVVRIW